MAMTPKPEFIQKVLCLLCKKCSRRKRIEERLKSEIVEGDFDHENDQIAAKIIGEEA